MKCDLLLQTPQWLSEKLPSFVKYVISKVPFYMRPAAAKALFPAAAAQMHDVTMRYIDNKLLEFSFMECCVAQSGVGKGYLDDMIDALTEYLRKHDLDSQKKDIKLIIKRKRHLTKK